mmetsp:Transcript_122640/g.212622  ORF Transcript_122640/g.212622 Transcript_122640/m.212622 type:complete len:115 (-) Transcript_122640:1264-1608(-)
MFVNFTLTTHSTPYPQATKMATLYQTAQCPSQKVGPHSLCVLFGSLCGLQCVWLSALVAVHMRYNNGQIAAEQRCTTDFCVCPRLLVPPATAETCRTTLQLTHRRQRGSLLPQM